MANNMHRGRDLSTTARRSNLMDMKKIKEDRGDYPIQESFSPEVIEKYRLTPGSTKKLRDHKLCFPNYQFILVI